MLGIFSWTYLSSVDPLWISISSTYFLLGCLFFFVYLFILRELGDRGWEWVCVGGTERERENPKQAPHCQRRAWCGAQTCELWDYDLSWDQELDTNLLSHPGTQSFYWVVLLTWIVLYMFKCESFLGDKFVCMFMRDVRSLVFLTMSLSGFGMRIMLTW